MFVPVWVLASMSGLLSCLHSWAATWLLQSTELLEAGHIASNTSLCFEWEPDLDAGRGQLVSVPGLTLVKTVGGPCFASAALPDSGCPVHSLPLSSISLMMVSSTHRENSVCLKEGEAVVSTASCVYVCVCVRVHVSLKGFGHRERVQQEMEHSRAEGYSRDHAISQDGVSGSVQ